VRTAGPVSHRLRSRIDLAPEIARVRAEVRGISSEALSQWAALKPPTVTGQPPTLKDTGYQAQQILGKLMNYDENISPFRNEACASCHMPYTGYSGPIPSVNLTMIAYPGTFHYRAAKRTPRRYPYSPDWPVLEFNNVFESFMAGTFGTDARLDIVSKVPTLSRHNILPSTAWKWASRT
jgi:cytochrome c peroxidase